MPCLRALSFILTFSVLYPEALAGLNERSIEAVIDSSYESGLPTICERSCITTITASARAFFPECTKQARPDVAIRISAPTELAIHWSSPLSEFSSTSLIYRISPKPSTQSVSIHAPGKRGVAYNDASLVSAFQGHPSVTWAYNWAETTFDIPPSIEYVPMLWGLTSDVHDWQSNAEKAISSGATHLLAFNEPDMDSQANLTVAAAVDGYLDHMQPFAGKVKLGSPAVTNGGGDMGLRWLETFLYRCSSCTIDFVAIHWYNGGNAGVFKAYVMRAYQISGYRPVWITEFQGPQPEVEEVSFLKEVLPWLDSQDYVHRYAYFMAAEGSLISGHDLSRIGDIFVS